MENVILFFIVGQFLYGLEIVDLVIQNVIFVNVKFKFNKKSNIGILYIKYMKYIVYISILFMENIFLKVEISFLENL